MSFALSPTLSARIADLYRRMERAYDIVAQQLDFTCDGCPDNCCDSYFQHHTYLEWAYLWEGLSAMPEARRKLLLDRAADYAAKCEEALAKGERPAVMCPLNEEGRCTLYDHRLMICRMHGVPSSLTFPNGQGKTFPGCARCQDLTRGKAAVPTVERTPLLRELAMLEQELLGKEAGVMPKVKKTIADMIILGPPTL